MKKVILSVCLLLSVNLFADLILNGNKEYREGSYSEAIQTYKKACDIDNAVGCNHVATMYIKGNGVKQDAKKAIKFMSKACDLSNAKACYDLAYFYYRGLYVEEDKSKAISLFDRACNAGSVKGCKNYKRLKNAGVK